MQGAAIAAAARTASSDTGGVATREVRMAVLAIMAAAARAFRMTSLAGTASRPLVAAVAAALAGLGNREESMAGRDTTAPLSAARLSPFPARATAVPPAAGERALEGKLMFLIGSCFAAGLLFDCLSVGLFLCCYGFL
jgi:hypothetical protein